MATSTINLEMSFVDETKRDLKLGPFAPTAAAITNLKTNIQTVNANVSDIEELYISDAGAKFSGITGAEIVTVDETEINLND